MAFEALKSFISILTESHLLMIIFLPISAAAAFALVLARIIFITVVYVAKLVVNTDLK